MTHRRTLVLSAALVPAFGFTSNCNYFQNVTVPASDVYRPVMATHLWIGGVESLQLGWADEVVTDPADAVIVVAPAIWDSGGAHTLNLSEFATVECANDATGAASLVDIHFVPQATSQSGGPGSVVSNGMYLLGWVNDLSNILPCGPGSHLVEADYSWVATGTDFFGNAGDPFFGSIVYIP